MEIQYSNEGGILEITLTGRLDSATAEGLSRFLEDEMTEETEKVVFDVGGLDFISSKGLRILVGVRKQLGEGRVSVKNPNTAVREVLKISGLTEILGVL